MIENHNGTIAVSGDSVKPVAELMRLHGWRNAANMKIKFAMSSKHYPTIKAFNAEYGVKATSWAMVLECTTDVINQIRAELKGDQS